MITCKNSFMIAIVKLFLKNKIAILTHMEDKISQNSFLNVYVYLRRSVEKWVAKRKDFHKWLH